MNIHIEQFDINLEAKVDGQTTYTKAETLRFIHHLQLMIAELAVFHESVGSTLTARKYDITSKDLLKVLEQNDYYA